MSLERELEIIPGYREGRKIDQQTGEPKEGEYSYDLEEAEKFIRQVRDIQERIKTKEEKVIPGREEEQSKTLGEMWTELQECASLIKELRTDRNWKDELQAHMDELQAHMNKLQEEMIHAADRLGIMKMEDEIATLTQQADFLINHDRITDVTLRRMHDHGQPLN